MFDPVTIILVLLLVLVTILYFTKKPKDRVELKLLNSIFKEVSLPLSSPDGKFKLEYKTEEQDVSGNNIKISSPYFVYENKEVPLMERIVIGYNNNTTPLTPIYLLPISTNFFFILENLTNNNEIKFYESYNNNMYELAVILNNKFLVSNSYFSESTTKPKLSLSDDKKFVISNVTPPGTTNTDEGRFEILGI